MKRKFRDFALIIGLAFICLIISGCSSFWEQRSKKIFNRYYGLMLSEDDKILYKKKPVSWTVNYYLVIQYAEEPTEMLNKKHFYTNDYAKATEEEKKEYKQKFASRLNYILSEEKLEITDIPEEFRPDWECEFLFAGNLNGGNDPYPLGSSYYYLPQQNKLIFWTTVD